MSHRSRFAVVVLAVASLASTALACASFGAEELAATDGGVAEGGAESGAETGADLDSAVPIEGAAPDASVFDAGSSFCTQKPYAFCADFDDVPAPWGFGRTVVSKGNGGATGSLTIAGAPVDSPPSLPNALRARLEPTGVSAALFASIPASSSVLRLEVDVRMHQGVETFVALVGVSFTPQRYVAVGVADGVLKLSAQSGVGGAVTASSRTIGNAWTHLAIDYDTTAGAVDLIADGVAILKGLAAPVKQPSEAVEISLGLQSGDFAVPTPTELLFDNFAVTWR